MTSRVDFSVLFQSLFFWNSPSDLPMSFVWLNRRDVSILVFLELAFGHDSAPSAFADCMFQSLFFWNSPSDLIWADRAEIACEFQSLFFWNSPSDPRKHAAYVPDGGVSILVFLELAFGPRDAKAHSPDSCIVSILVFLELAFGPAQTRFSDVMRYMFQSLFFWNSPSDPISWGPALVES